MLYADSPNNQVIWQYDLAHMVADEAIKQIIEQINGFERMDGHPLTIYVHAKK